MDNLIIPPRAYHTLMVRTQGTAVKAEYLPCPPEGGYGFQQWKLENIDASTALTKKVPFNKYINESTMGALNNWAKHEDFIVRLDLFKDKILKVMLFKQKDNNSIHLFDFFDLALPEKTEKLQIGTFLRTLFVNIEKAANKIRNYRL